jgi:hypothetical protein
MDLQHLNHQKGSDTMKTKLVACSLFVVLALSLTLPQSYGSAFAAQGARSCFPPPAGSTGCWPGDGTTDDIVGGRDAELVDDAGFVEGVVDQAFILDGEGDYVNVPHDPALNLGTGDFTVSLWVYFNDTSEEQVLIEKWIQNMNGPEENSVGWTLTKLDSNVLRLALDDYSGEIDVDSDVLSIPIETWTHFAATRKSGIITLYMNGTPVATGDAPLNLDSNSSLKFGHRGSPDDTPGSLDDRGFYLNGRIDEVELFVGRALPPELIRATLPEPIGAEISIWESGSQVFAANTPFHIDHGWQVDPTTGYPIGKFLFVLEIYGSRVEPDYVHTTFVRGTDEPLQRLWVYNFPDGMSGSQEFTGHWFAPCGYVVEYGEYQEDCPDPFTIVEARVSTVEVEFGP